MVLKFNTNAFFCQSLTPDNGYGFALVCPSAYNGNMYIGLDVGGTKILAGASPDGRRLVKTEKISTPTDPKKAIAVMTDLAFKLAGSQPIASVGVSSPGPLDLQKGIMLTPPNLPWRNFEIKRQLEQSLSANVTVQHDAACGGIAEATLGSGSGFKRVLYVTISTGIGVGLIVDGQAYHGNNTNIEAGHMTIQQDGPICSCGAKGHFEAMASGRAIKRSFGKYAYEIKDRSTWEKIAAIIAAGLASFIAVYAPDVVVLAGGVNVHFKKFQRPLIQNLEQDFRYGIPEIRLAKYVETAPVIGALLLASQAEHLLL
jgi:glucokinase